MKQLTHIRDFFSVYKWDGRPFLIVGMGPTFSEIKDVDLSSYNILGLNKVPREIKVDICQIIDSYIVNKISEELYSNAKYLVMPYFPHLNCRPYFEFKLSSLLFQNDTLLKFHNEGRLLGFNLSTVPFTFNSSPIITARYFSAEAAVSLLGNLGVKTIRTIGIDGGTTRASEFSDHGPCDPRGFDIQWPGINYTIERFNIDYKSLKGDSDAVRKKCKPSPYGVGKKQIWESCETSSSS